MVEADGYPFQWEDVKNAVTTYEEAWRSGDANAVMDIFTDDAMYIERPTKYSEGRAQIGEMWSNVIAKQTVLDFTAIEDDWIVDAEKKSAMVKWSATFETAGGKKFEGVWCVILRFRWEEEDNKYRVCWYEEFWHRLPNQDEDRKGKGKNKGQNKGENQTQKQNNTGNQNKGGGKQNGGQGKSENKNNLFGNKKGQSGQNNKNGNKNWNNQSGAGGNKQQGGGNKQGGGNNPLLKNAPANNNWKQGKAGQNNQVRKKNEKR
eukprot:g8794.t1